QRKYQLGKTIGFLEMRIARHDEGVDADVLILLDPRRDSWGIADQRRSRATAYQADAGPEVRADLELVAAPAMQLRHALLADRVHPREDLLRGSHGLVGDVLNQFVGGLPRARGGPAHTHTQPDAEGKPPPAPRGNRPPALDLCGALRRRLAPCQILS